jgi:hypothetical protein
VSLHLLPVVARRFTPLTAATTLAASAWNIACNPPEVRQQHLEKYLREYRRCNHDVDRQEVEEVRDYTEKLIEKKLRMFPDHLRQIIGAQMVQSGGKDRIEVVSARFD